MAIDQRHPRLDRLIVTRPAAEAGLWTQRLAEAGWPAEALPLITIGAPQSPEVVQKLQAARTNWSECDALMFVSSAAVNRFFATGVALSGDTGRTRFWAPGPATGRSLARALQGMGLGTDRIDMPPSDAEQFDSEALWPVVWRQMGPNKRLLVVRGTSSSGAALPAGEPGLAGQGREWLIQQCVALGAQVDACVAYERGGPDWSAPLRERAAAAAAPGSLWLLSSSEALTHLCEGLPEADWGAAAALATHPRIAEAAHKAGFGRVQSSRPALPDVLRALESEWTPP